MMKEVMTNAWMIAKNAAKKFGGKAIEYIAGALKMAWRETKKAGKGMTEAQVKALIAKGFSRWTTDDGKHDRLYLDVYNHEGMLHYGEWDGEKIPSSEQRAIKGIKTWIDVKTGKIDSRVIPVNRYTDFYVDEMRNAVEKDLEEIA